MQPWKLTTKMRGETVNLQSHGAAKVEIYDYNARRKGTFTIASRFKHERMKILRLCFDATLEIYN